MTWEQVFHRARKAGYGNQISVSKQDVGPIPHGFIESETPFWLPTVYKQHRGSEKVYIYDFWIHYLVKIEQEQPLAGSGSTPSGQHIGAVLVGSVFLFIVAVSLCVSLVIRAFSGNQSQPVPEQGEQRVFISHSWSYNDHREELTEMLDRERGFKWYDYSVPSDDPIDAQLENHLRKKLRDQIRPTSVVLCLAGMYAAHSDWINEELQIASEMGKPILGIRPPENDRTPNVVSEHADEIVPLDRKAVQNAINRYST